MESRSPRTSPWRRFLAATLACTALLASTGGCAQEKDDRPPGCRHVSEKLEPACGAWLGIWPRTRADGTMSVDLGANLASLEERLGRRIDLVSRYYGWGQEFPDAWDRQWRDGNRILLIDLRARNFSTNTYVSWRSIADGEHDEYLARLGARMRDFGAPVFFSFNQEPEQELEKGTRVAGTAADFAAAYRHVREVFARAGARNVVWVWWIMGYLGHTGWYHALYPGDRYVDWISYDPYDFNSCKGGGHETPEQSVMPFLTWLTASGIGSGKPVMLSEFGSNGTDRHDWYAGLGDVVKKAPRIKAIVSFNSNPGGCDTRVTNSESNWRGFAGLAADPYFRQRG